MAIKKGDFVYTTSTPALADKEKRYGLVLEITGTQEKWARVLWIGCAGTAYVPIDTLMREDHGES
jgi:hypothetical protein